VVKVLKKRVGLIIRCLQSKKDSNTINLIKSNQFLWNLTIQV
jgi:hypothetical protein